MVMIPLAELIEGSNVLKDLDIHKCLIKRLEEPGISLAESISNEQTMTIGAKQTPLEDLEEPGARCRRDAQLIREIIQLENDLGRELSLSEVYQKFGSRIAAINDVLPFLVKWEDPN